MNSLPRFRIRSHDGQPVTLAEQPLALAPDGALYAVTDPANLMPGLVKVFAPETWGPLLADRLNLLRGLRAPATELAWPVERIFEGNQQAGYWTVLAEKAQPLRPWLDDLMGSDLARRRLRLCQHLARTVADLHATRCVVATLSPDFLLVRPNGLVQLINLDACQLQNPDGTLLLPARLSETAYTPPEVAQWLEAPFVLTPAWDYFSLAAIFHEILFQNPGTGPSDRSAVSKKLREAFVNGLGNDPAQRPSAAAWVQLLELEINPPPPMPPVIERFSATPTQLDPGDPVRLEWVAKNVELVRLVGPGAPPGGLQPEGDLLLYPANSAAYTLVVDTVEARVDVFVREVPPLPPMPQVLQFDLNPQQVRVGEPVTVRWRTGHAATVTLLGEEAPKNRLAAEGEIRLTLQKPGSHTYALRAENASGTQDARVQVQVVRPPSRAWVWWLLAVLGGLGWFIGYLLNSGSKAEPEAEKPPAETRREPVQPPRREPRIIFTVSPVEIREGETALLSWQVDNADTLPIRLSGPGAKPFNRTATGRTTTPPTLPPGTHTYELSVGDRSSRVEVVVHGRGETVGAGPEAENEALPTPAEARILTFGFRPDDPAPGDAVDLYWKIENAERAELYGPTGFIDNVPAVGTRTVYPTQNALYRLQAGDARRKIVVNVVARPNSEATFRPFHCESGLWGYSDGERLVIPCRYEKAGPFINGEARVVLNGENRVIDRQGKLLD